MPVTSEQKAEIGLGYLALLNGRIKVRQDAKKKADTQYSATSTDHIAIAKGWLKKHRIDAAVISADTDTCYRQGPNLPCLKIVTELGDFKPALSLFPSVATEKKVRDELNKLRESLCTEYTFLHGLLAPGKVAEFQTHVARLWAPESKDVSIPATVLKDLFEGFVDAKRPATCSVS